MAHIIGKLGCAALAGRKHKDAKRLIAESLSLRRELGHSAGIIFCLAQFAALSAVTNQPGKAAALSGAVEKLLEAAGTRTETVNKRGYGRYLASAREQLGGTAWQAAQATGRAMTMEEAVLYAHK